jgi:hypothetical protein
LEANPEEIESEAVPKEKAAVETVRALKKRHRDWHLATRRHGQPKKQTQGNGGSQKKLAVVYREMTRYAIPAQHKDHCCQGQRKGQGCTKNPENMDVQEETLGKTGRHHWNKEPELMTRATSGKQDNTWQELQEDRRAVDCKANSRDYH